MQGYKSESNSALYEVQNVMSLCDPIWHVCSSSGVRDFGQRTAVSVLLYFTLLYFDFGRRAFAVCGSEVWNNFPPSLRTATSHSALRRALN